jgi:NtrC-family two-component system response regulator AlgB
MVTHQPRLTGPPTDLVRSGSVADMTSSDLATPSKLSVLIVDDEANIRTTLVHCLSADGHAVIAVADAADALAETRRNSFDMALVDLKLRLESGMDLIPRLRSESPWTKVVVITAFASVESAVEAMRLGATDYLAKPFSPNQLRLVARRVAEVRSLEHEVFTLREGVRDSSTGSLLETSSAPMERALETARRAATSEATVLLRGENGVGKSVLARAIHSWSARAAMPFAVVPCPAVPADLFEGELFGHAKGAFTGAVAANAGRIASCHGGTLLLDEVGDIPLTVQAKLLHFLEEREYTRLGDPTPRRADVRVLAATNADLQQRVSEGRFREDLFYRLNVISLTVPPLRDRREDILPLALAFLRSLCQVNRKMIDGFTPAAEVALTNHLWPGNVRELRNAVERGVILAVGTRLDRGDLPETITPRAAEAAIGDLVPLSTIEEAHIRRVLARMDSLQSAAEVLGIDLATLWRRRKAYGI